MNPDPRTPPLAVEWSFLGEIPAGMPARFAVPDPEHEGGRRLFDCDLLAAMCAAYLGTGFSPAST